MSDFIEMTRQYTVKHHVKINTFTSPLKQLLGNCSFCYNRIEQDGRYSTLSDRPEILEFYYGKHFYLDDPFCAHPDLIRSGTLLIPNLHYLPHMKPQLEQIKGDSVFVMIENKISAIECFYFVTLTKDRINPNIFLANLESLKSFNKYFKREANPLLKKMRNDGFNIKNARGAAFTKIDPANPLANKDPKIERFLKLIIPLSRRERQCLQLYKEGKSAQATGAILEISRRTVESYFESIKNKLGFHSKAELLEW